MERAPPTTPVGWGPSQVYLRAQGVEAGEGPLHLSSRWTRCCSQSSQTIPTGPHSPLRAFSHCNESCGRVLFSYKIAPGLHHSRTSGQLLLKGALPGAPKQSVIIKTLMAVTIRTLAPPTARFPWDGSCTRLANKFVSVTPHGKTQTSFLVNSIKCSKKWACLGEIQDVNLSQGRGYKACPQSTGTAPRLGGGVAKPVSPLEMYVMDMIVDAHCSIL